MNYLVSEKQREYEAELIESGEAARCEECGEIFEDIHNDSIYDNVICSRCAENEAEAITKTIRRLALENAANSDERQRAATVLSFMMSLKMRIKKQFQSLLKMQMLN